MVPPGPEFVACGAGYCVPGQLRGAVVVVRGRCIYGPGRCAWKRGRDGPRLGGQFRCGQISGHGNVDGLGPFADVAERSDGAYLVVVGCAGRDRGVGEAGVGEVVAAELQPAAGGGPGPEFVTECAGHGRPAQFNGAFLALRGQLGDREVGCRGRLLGLGNAGAGEKGDEERQKGRRHCRAV